MDKINLLVCYPTRNLQLVSYIFQATLIGKSFRHNAIDAVT